jgi:hypothetical protein
MSPNPRLFLSPPHMGGRESEFVQQAFASNYIAPLGPMVDAFEREFGAYVGLPHCLALASGTAATHLALRHLGVKPGDEILASTLTFIGSVTPATFERATLAFIDCDETSWNMDPALLEQALAEGAKRGQLPKAVIPTDLYGLPCDLPRIRAICDRHGVPVICDSAEAVGARCGERHAGADAWAATYSFQRQQDHHDVGRGHAGFARQGPDRPRPQAVAAGARSDPVVRARGDRLQLPDEQRAGGHRPRPARGAGRPRAPAPGNLRWLSGAAGRFAGDLLHAGARGSAEQPLVDRDPDRSGGVRDGHARGAAGVGSRKRRSAPGLETDASPAGFPRGETVEGGERGDQRAPVRARSVLAFGHGHDGSDLDRVCGIVRRLRA